MYGLKGGAVSIPRWILGFRAAQLFFAILVLALTAYSLSVDGGGPLQRPLIATIIIAILTLIPILLLTTPLHLAQRKSYDPRIALVMDGFATLYWLAAFAALASYLHIFNGYGRGFVSLVGDVEVLECRACRRAWRTAVAACVFAGVEFLLFLLTTLAFLYYYHFHTADLQAPGIPHRGATDKTTTTGTTGATAAAAGAPGTTGAATAGATTGHATHEGEHHQMEAIPHQSTNANTANPGAGAGGQGTYGTYSQPTNSQHNDPAYPTNGPRSPRQQGGYGGYENGASNGYGADGRQV